MDLKAELDRARLNRKSLHKYLDRVKRNPPRDLDQLAADADEQVFQEIDCLECANCCKTISPIFTNRDVERIAPTLKMTPGKFTETYLRVDEDQDLVLKSSPCPFLQADNRCRIYEDRPKACREYPHTGQRKFHSHIGITKKNVLVCPAALRVVERLMGSGV